MSKKIKKNLEAHLLLFMFFFIYPLFTFLSTSLSHAEEGNRDDHDIFKKREEEVLTPRERALLFYKDEDELEELRKQSLPPYPRAMITSKVFLEKIELVWPALQQALKEYGFSQIKEKQFFIVTRTHDDTLEQQFFEEDFPYWTSTFTILALLKEVIGPKKEKGTQIFLYQKRKVLPPPHLLYEEEVEQLKDQKQDFIWKAFPTDGVREHVILYRVKRYISLYHLLEKEKKKRPVSSSLPEKPKKTEKSKETEKNKKTEKPKKS
jgi:hypothetical protein